MLVLFETAAGFAVFKLLDEKKLQEVSNLFEDFQTVEGANKVVQLQKFKKFDDYVEALQAGLALSEGKLCKPLKKMLKKVYAEEAHEQLLVWDAKLGSAIKNKIGMECISNTTVGELMRCIKSQVDALIPGLEAKELAAMSLGLAHNLTRYKLKFSPDKVDTMIVQAVSLLDDIDKELNNYMMRAKEWYGWHFPELTKIITDNLMYVKAVVAMGTRDNAISTDFSKILPEDLEERLKEAAEISVGTEIAEDDIFNINLLCQQVIDLTEYRGQLYEYLQNRMNAIAPNVTILVGELVGARLIAHAGSLLNLAKHPASTIQIIGAEKALFRALKKRQSTPKYGLIYHAHLVGQSSSKNKGKISRMLAAKTALACRYDALGEETTVDMGTEIRAKLASRMSMIESGYTTRISGKGKEMARHERYEKPTHIPTYPVEADSTMPSSSKKRKATHDESWEEQKPVKLMVEMDNDEEVEERPKKKKKKMKLEEAEAAQEVTPAAKKKKMKLEDAESAQAVTPAAKKKKMKLEEAEVAQEVTPAAKKKKMKLEDAESAQAVTPVAKKKKKKEFPGDGSTPSPLKAEEPQKTPESKKKKKAKKLLQQQAD